MCGIFTARNITPDLHSILYQKFSTLHRRGYIDNSYIEKIENYNLYCYFQRLPLVSIPNKNANAPYVAQDGTIVMLNGEIYNYKKDYAPSEVEWIYELYKKDKRTLFYLSILKGEFAYVIIDRSMNRLICYRSFPGVISLYGWFTKYGSWIVSSEKLYKKQKQIEPGVYYIYRYSKHSDKGELKKVKKDFDYILDIQEPPDVDEFNRLFHNVVRDYILHKDDDIKITVSYSGGVDSTYILLHVLSDEELRKEVTQIVSCHYSGTPEYEMLKSNLEYVKNKFGIPYYIIDMHKHKPIDIQQEVIKRLPSAKNNVIKLRSALRNYLVAKFSVNPIIIGGEGADELFGGYPFFKGTDFLTFKRIQVQAIYSMKAINLDRTNNVPFIFTKEWRVPFLDYRIINFALQHQFEYGKGYLKNALFKLRQDSMIELDVLASKYGSEEKLSEQYLKMKSHDVENQ